MILDAFAALVSDRLTVPSAIPSCVPTMRLAQDGIATATGGFDPGRIGGAAAGRVQGRSALPDELFINSIVGLYYVSSTRGL
jgi:hypothetical protein